MSFLSGFLSGAFVFWMLLAAFWTLGRRNPAQARLLVLLRWPALVGVLTNWVYALTLGLPAPLVATTTVLDLLLWLWLRNAGDDDETRRRRRQRLLGRVRAVGGRLVVAPVRGEG